MSGKHSNTQSYIDVYDSVIKLVGELQKYLQTDEAKKYKQQMHPMHYYKEFQSLHIKTHRGSGMTTTALRLLRRDENNILIVPNSQMRMHLITSEKLDEADSKRVFTISNMLDTNFLRGRILKPALIIFDAYSCQSGVTYSPEFNALELMLQTMHEKIRRNIPIYERDVLECLETLSRTYIEDRIDKVITVLQAALKDQTPVFVHLG